MSRPASKEVEDLLDRAERTGSLATYANKAQAQCFYRRVESGEAISPLPKLFTRTRTWQSLDAKERMQSMMNGFSAINPGTVFAGPSAAIAHGLPVSHRRLRRLCVSQGLKAHSRNNARIERIIVDGDESETEGGYLVTSLARTAFDCLRDFDFRDGLAIADAVLRKTGWARSRLVEELSEFGPRRGVQHAIETACHADARSESGGESIARAVMIETGYQVPELQVEFAHPLEPGKVFRADFCWKLGDGIVVVGELDGREKYRSSEMTGGRDVVDVLADERLRETFINATGARVMRFSYKNVLDVPYFMRLLDLFGVPRLNE